MTVAQARDNLQGMGPEELQQYQEIIDMENPDLFRWLTGQEEVPAEIGNPLLIRLCNDLKSTIEPKAMVKSTASFEGKVWGDGASGSKALHAGVCGSGRTVP